MICLFVLFVVSTLLLLDGFTRVDTDYMPLCGGKYYKKYSYHLLFRTYETLSGLRFHRINLKRKQILFLDICVRWKTSTFVFLTGAQITLPTPSPPYLLSSSIFRPPSLPLPPSLPPCSLPSYVLPSLPTSPSLPNTSEQRRRQLIVKGTKKEKEIN